MPPRKVVPTTRRRTKVEIHADEGLLISETHLRLKHLAHDWEDILRTVRSTGHMTIPALESVELEDQQVRQIVEIASEWGLDAGLLIVHGVWQATFRLRLTE
jgi:hypothetical protein